MKNTSNPFAKWQSDKVKARAEYIEDALKELNSGRFKTISNLAEYIARLLTKHENNMYQLEQAKDGHESNISEPKPVSKSTVLRNETYRSLLDVFMSEKRRTLGDLATTGNVPELKIADLQMQVVNLKSDKARLEKYIDRREKEYSLAGPIDTDKTELLTEMKRQKHNSEMLAHALLQLYNSTPLKMLLGLENGNIVDYSSGGEIIVESRFIESIADRLNEIEIQKKARGINE